MLILSGGRDAEKVKPIDSFFANRIDKEKVLIYIPVAMEESGIIIDGEDVKEIGKKYKIKLL